MEFSPSSWRHVAALAAGVLCAHFAFGQTPVRPGEPASVETGEPSVVLSPFVVSGERDTGYAATDSLAGTRLRTSLKDIAASVSVVTKDFLDDVGATGTAELLLYTTGTE